MNTGEIEVTMLDVTCGRRGEGTFRTGLAICDMPGGAKWSQGVDREHG